METKELLEKDFELRSAINNYKLQNEDMRAQISFNDREIVKLQQKLLELHFRANNQEE